jgi:1-acyl-sn-glycerol-3-phosphate acyltransferase
LASYYSLLDYAPIDSAELVKVPILGTYMKSAEHILVSRDSRKSQLESLKSAISTIKKDRDVFIFPEGTRSLDGIFRLKYFDVISSNSKES